jgi:putative cardiolipin synthase
LASHDVPAVNSHYAPWRDEIIKAGVDLYELRADPEIKSIVNVPPAKPEFIGLHAKSSVVDRRYVFIGSMNLDPRSYNINTEMGVFVDSPELAEDLVKIILRDTRGENAWHVLLDEDGDVYWVNSDETVTSQPARDGMQRVMDVILKVVPKEQN